MELLARLLLLPAKSAVLATVVYYLANSVGNDADALRGHVPPFVLRHAWSLT